LIEATAAQTAQALENARLIQETQYKAYQEELIGEFSSRIRESLNLDSLLRTAVRELGDRLNLSEVEAYVGWDDWNQPE
jgi:GAF domain-containing protein